MEREAIKNLIEWNEKEQRKPLIIRGVRQVGKSYLINQFKDMYYKDNYILCSFDRDETLKNLFLTRNPDSLLNLLSIKFNKTITRDTLIILDEIQLCPEALSSLKAIYETHPDYHIICAGSLLGIFFHRDFSFPVGKVEFLDLYPLTFKEFLKVDNPGLYKLFETNDINLFEPFHLELVNELKKYYYIGGMPEVVQTYLDLKQDPSQAFAEVRTIQNNILDSYINDISKHNNNSLISLRIKEVFKSIPVQLAKENKKFVYKDIKENNKGKRDYQLAIEWLLNSGLVYKINSITKPNIPLESCLKESVFKLYFFDVGLLACMCKIDLSTLILKNNIFTEFKGALTENYVLNQLVVNKNLNICTYLTSSSTIEIEFLVDNGKSITPIEVKAETNLKAKSLKMFKEKYHPNKSIRTSLSAYKDKGDLIDLPLYLIQDINQFIN